MHCFGHVVEPPSECKSIHEKTQASECREMCGSLQNTLGVEILACTNIGVDLKNGIKSDWIRVKV